MKLKKLSALLAAGLLCLTAVTGCSQTPAAPENEATPTPSSDVTTMRVATWNIDSKAHPDIKEMSNIIHERGIEIMGFQEIDILNTRNDYDMAQDFVNDNYPYVHFAKGRDFADGYFGVGTTSTLEFQEISSVPIESTGSKATKTLERVVVEKEGKQIAFYVTHTSWENNDLRRRQFTEIIERLAADPVPYKILVADFNADQSLYEYDIFKDNYNIANGKDGVWFDSFNGEDDSMKVMTVDNIITTKNINITHVETYHSDMADHDLMWADIELLDEAAPMIEHDRALGQDVTATSTAEDSHPYNMVDCDDKTVWQSGEGEQEVILTLDRPYMAKKLNIQWGEKAPEAFHVETSLNGTDYTAAADGTKETTEIALNGEVKYVKLTLAAVEGGSQIATLSLFGEWITPTADSDANLLVNGDMESEEGWTLTDATTEGNAKFALAYEEAEAGNKAAKITKTGEEAGDASIEQTIEVKSNERYQLSFMHKTDTLHSGNFCYEVNQMDAEGNTISTHLAKLTDNLNMSAEFRKFDYNFITAANAASVKVALHVVGEGEGSLWLDQVSVKEVVPTECVYVKADKTTLKVGETAALSADILPKTANDIQMNWVSLDESLASVDENGTVTAKAAGKVLVGLLSDSDLLAESYVLITIE
ncbi:Ig-like domain-containing protein [Holdemania massiliensis]|uniref:BIG2 domain-containing protein n=1 Tax=Holdemania massiliensis TaxID=1468449 RepID=A0A6N7SDQ7_9FIRM|nr:Ig-like domain-containing protein [Holdemania massiliensis]MSA73239.1 hypothetical protein [Holdemania massiliensis]MSA91426.1 hypothetical protein [Holdemania massiliensis]MSB80303.1 hypothetical protein [Holdemania massiliensis]MSC35224.1 hypothetical protein [Holdemania massiliensis]MSC41613.1 hypothetical protein [Holdemania massiliensis]